MRVERFMSTKPITVSVDTAVTDALSIMTREKIDLIPVINHRRQMVGIISERDLLYASPSPASTLSVYEMSALLSKLTVDKVMSSPVVSVSPQTPIEEAARLLAEKNITGMPVLENNNIVGMITDSDLFEVFSELFGTRQRGLQISLLVPEKPGELAAISTALFQAGANIISLGSFPGDSQNNALLVIKVESINEEKLRQVLGPYSEKIEEIRAC